MKPETSQVQQQMIQDIIWILITRSQSEFKSHAAIRKPCYNNSQLLATALLFNKVYRSEHYMHIQNLSCSIYQSIYHWTIFKTRIIKNTIHTYSLRWVPWHVSCSQWCTGTKTKGQDKTQSSVLRSWLLHYVHVVVGWVDAQVKVWGQWSSSLCLANVELLHNLSSWKVL